MNAMEQREQLKHYNQKWQEDDQRWQEEIEHWQHSTQRMVALIYLLEKSLPEHSSSIEKHKKRIDEHNAEIVRYECGLDEHCLSTCPSHIELERHQKMHRKMQLRHEEMKKEHDRFSRNYQKQMQRVRELAERLLNELD
ncbi:hypothetical protein GCM10025856_07340 [Methylophaga marina]|uniref:C2H2-type domain-containing protein n=1 Tax=Methylophaga marina TaxID=45495 RepID=A0ABP3CSU2_9GAMM|nr:hypothetical protein [Methylophaga marina]BDZ73015.1 hypothetical protein GCM10025856_07340 [Methylophaga marina]